MTNELFINLIQQYGYFALFFALWLGIVGMPIPDEAVVMTGGFVTSFGLLDPIPAFMLTYLGVVSGLSLGYILGKIFGLKILNRILQNRRASPNLTRARALLDRHGHYAIVLSYYLPIVRHLVPYLVGIANMPYYKYALYSYSSGFLWTLIYFLTGRFFGNHIEQIVEQTREYGWCLLIIIIVGCIIWNLYYRIKPGPTLKRDAMETSTLTVLDEETQ